MRVPAARPLGRRGGARRSLPDRRAPRGARPPGPHAVYGWEFFDIPEEEDFARWKDRLSLDWQAPGDDGRSHTLALFQEAAEAHLDLCFWFDDLVVHAPSHEEIPLDEFAAGGKRWWDALYAGDQRTADSGIVPLAAEATEPD